MIDYGYFFVAKKEMGKHTNLSNGEVEIIDRDTQFIYEIDVDSANKFLRWANRGN